MKQLAEKLKNDVTIDDIPKDELKHIVDICGIKTALQLFETFSGCNIYFPTKVSRHLIRKHIINNYDGTTQCIKAFSREFNLSEQAIYSILKRATRKGK